MSKTTYLKEAWEAMAADVIPPGAPPIQIQEMRRAFYAGAQSIITVLMTNLDDTEDPDEVTVKDEELWENIQSELVEFGAAIQRGEA